jgi:Pin2-interacting protein X1
MTSHIKISIKSDNTGLGKVSSNKRNKTNDFDGEITMGLDAFQRILGKLNGKSQDQVNEQIQQQRNRVVLNNPKFGMVFVHGGVLEGSVEQLLNEKDEENEKSDSEIVVKKEKRKRSNDEDNDGSESKKEKKKSKRQKPEKDKSEKKKKVKRSREDKKSKISENKKDRKKPSGSDNNLASLDEAVPPEPTRTVLKGRLA